MHIDSGALRQAIGSLNRPFKTTAIPSDLRKKALQCVIEKQSLGESWSSIGRFLGLSSTTVKRWYDIELEAKAAKRSRGPFLPVRVEAKELVTEAERSLVLVSPSGYRLEGIRVTEAAKLLKALAS